MNASRLAAAQLNASLVAQTYLRGFLASSPDQRRQTIQQVQNAPETQQYAGLVLRVANTCNNY